MVSARKPTERHLDSRASVALNRDVKCQPGSWLNAAYKRSARPGRPAPPQRIRQACLCDKEPAKRHLDRHREQNTKRHLDWHGEQSTSTKMSRAAPRSQLIAASTHTLSAASNRNIERRAREPAEHHLYCHGKRGAQLGRYFLRQGAGRAPPRPAWRTKRLGQDVERRTRETTERRLDRHGKRNAHPGR